MRCCQTLCVVSDDDVNTVVESVVSDVYSYCEQCLVESVRTVRFIR